MRPINTIEVIVLTVLIVAGSAVSSEAEDGRFYLPVSVTSALAGFVEENMSWARRLISWGSDGVLNAAGG